MAVSPNRLIVTFLSIKLSIGLRSTALSLYYPTLEQKTGKRGHPKWFDGRIDFANLDLTRCKEYKVNKGRLYGLRVYAKALKRYVSLAIWYPMDGRTDKWQLYFSTEIPWMDVRCWIITEEYKTQKEELFLPPRSNTPTF